MVEWLAGNRVLGTSNERPTFGDNFSSYADQPSADASWISDNVTYTRVNITNDNIAFTANGSPSRDIYHVLGNNISNTAWVLRFKIRFSTYNVGIGYGQFWFGLTSSPTGTYSSDQDGVVMWGCRNSVIRISYGDGQPISTNISSNITPDFTINTDYYVELKRTSATNVTLTVFANDPTYTTSTASGSYTIASSVTGLNSIVLYTDGAVGTNGEAVGIIDDVKFYNGVTSPTSLDILSLQTGCEFHETDTNRDFVWNGSSFKHIISNPLNIAIVMGGNTTNDATFTNTTEEYNGTTWSAGGNIATGKSSAASGGNNGDAFMAAGYTGSYSQVTELYNGTSWSTDGNTGHNTTSCGSGGNSSDAILFGGIATVSMATAKTYNGVSWNTISSLNTNSYYDTGGGNSTDAIKCMAFNTANAKTTEEYNGTTWSYSTPPATQSSYANGAGGNTTNAILFGGFGPIIATTEEYNGTTWSTVSSMLTARGRLANSSGNRDKAMAAGGEKSGGPPFYYATAETYNGTTWSSIANITTNRGSHGGGANA